MFVLALILPCPAFWRVWGLVGIFCLCVFSATHGSNTAFFCGDSSIISNLFCSEKKRNRWLWSSYTLNDTFEVLTCAAPLGQCWVGQAETMADSSDWLPLLWGVGILFPRAGTGMSCWQKQLSRAGLCKSLIDYIIVRLRLGWKIKPHEGGKGSRDKLLLCLWSCGSKWN